MNKQKSLRRRYYEKLGKISKYARKFSIHSVQYESDSNESVHNFYGPGNGLEKLDTIAVDRNEDDMAMIYNEELDISEDDQSSNGPISDDQTYSVSLNSVLLGSELDEDAQSMQGDVKDIGNDLEGNDGEDKNELASNPEIPVGPSFYTNNTTEVEIIEFYGDDDQAEAEMIGMEIMNQEGWNFEQDQDDGSGSDTDDSYVIKNKFVIFMNF